MTMMTISGFHPIQEEWHKDDAYYTPRQVIPALLSKSHMWSGIKILDFGAGEWRWGDAIREMCPDCFLVGVDIADVPKPKSYDKWYPNTDFMTWEYYQKFDFIVGNPPYNIFKKALPKVMDMLHDGGEASFLLRLSFLGSASSKKLFDKYPLKNVLVSSRRIPFVASNGKSNSTVAYAQFTWQKGWMGGNNALIDFIDWKEYNATS